MKKLYILLLLPFFIACSSDDNEGDPKETPLNITNEQIIGTYTLTKALDKNGALIDYGYDFSRITYELKNNGDAIETQGVKEYKQTWERNKNIISIFGDGIMGGGNKYNLQINSSSKVLELSLDSNTETIIYSKN